MKEKETTGLKSLAIEDMKDNNMTSDDLLTIYDISADYLSSLSFKDFIDLEFKGHNKNECH